VLGTICGVCECREPGSAVALEPRVEVLQALDDIRASRSLVGQTAYPLCPPRQGGRRDDDFRYGETTVPAIAFRHVLGTNPRVSEYQVVQTATGADIVVVGAPDAAALTGALIAALRRYGLSEPAIQIRVAASLPRNHASGKLRRFIPLKRR
jgi:hypothetical protein